MRRPLVVPALLAAALLATAAIFYLMPDIDLDVAGQFYRGRNMFAAQSPAGELVRRVVYWVPTGLLAGCCALTSVRWSGRRVRWAPTGRGLIFLALSFALGPGLLVNTVLKDHSHRPRPYQTLNFGGDHAFRPYYTFDGDCERNCSFVSGEGSAAAWALAPALLTPPSVQALAVAASMAFALGVGLLRMAFGGHYLSDTLFAFLLTWGLVWALWRVMVSKRAPLAQA